MVRAANIETRQEGMEEKIDELKESFDSLAKKILTWLLIAGALIGLIQFLGPSIRKAVGMAQTSETVVAAQSAEMPSTYITR